MARDAIIRARIATADKEAGEKILAELGMTTSDALNLFWAQLVRQRGLPFPVRLGDASTARRTTDDVG